MPYITKVMKKTVEVIISIRCDRCGIIYDYDNASIPDQMAIQEFVSIDNECGFGSIFGDGNIFNLTLCQNCLDDVLGVVINKHIKERNKDADSEKRNYT